MSKYKPFNESQKNAISAIKSKLVEFMEIEGISLRPNNSFSCPNYAMHSNGDKNPSASVQTEHESGPKWKCHRCGEGGDTFDMANITRGYEIEGPGFLLETIPELCNELNIALPVSDDNEETAIDPTYILQSEAKKYIKDNLITAKELIGEKYGRNYTKEFAEQILKAYPIAKGIDKQNRKNPLLYHGNKDTLLIPIMYDGVLKGTVTRTAKDSVDEDGEPLPKYLNSPKQITIKGKGKEEDVVIEMPYETVLNLSKGMAKARREKIVVVMEGVFNTLACITTGLPTVGILGTNAGWDIIRERASKTEVIEVIIVTDKDRAGIDAGVNYGRMLSNHGISISYFYDTESDDDYDVVISRDPEAFRQRILNHSNRLTFVEFLIKFKGEYMNDERLTPLSRYANLMKDIAMFGSGLLVKMYARHLKETLPELMLDESDMVSNIRDAIRDSNSPVMKKINNLVSKEAQSILDSDSLEEKRTLIDGMYLTAKKIVDTSMGSVVSIGKRKMAELVKPQEIDNTVVFTTGYANLDTIGPQTGTPVINFTDSLLVGLAGKPGHGKSSLLRGISMHIARNFKDEAFVIYYSTDDSAKRCMTWMVASLSGVPFVRTQSVLYPTSHSRGIIVTEDERTQVLQAREMIGDFLGDTLMIYDKSSASSADEIMSITRRYCDEYSTKIPIIIVDNMYNINDIARAEIDKRKAVEMYIDKAKEFSITERALFINSLELTKIEGRFTSNAIKESGAVEYRNDVTIALFNSWKEYQKRSNMVDYNDAGYVSSLYIELEILKDKVSASGQVEYFELDGPVATLLPVCDIPIKNDLERRRAYDPTNAPRSIGGEDTQQGTEQTTPKVPKEKGTRSSIPVFTSDSGTFAGDFP